MNVYAGKSVSFIMAVENQENAYVFIFSIRPTAADGLNQMFKSGEGLAMQRARGENSNLEKF